jgi:hypothetical protein
LDKAGHDDRLSKRELETKVRIVGICGFVMMDTIEESIVEGFVDFYGLLD